MVTAKTLIFDLPVPLSVHARNVCVAAGIATVGDLLAFESIRLLGLPHCGHKTVAELEAIRSRYADVTAVGSIALPTTDPLTLDAAGRRQLRATLFELAAKWQEPVTQRRITQMLADVDEADRLLRYEDYFATLPVAVQECFQRRLDRARAQLSVRGRNVTRRFSQYASILQFISQRTTLDLQTLKSCGHKTFPEVKAMLVEEGKYFRKVMEESDGKGCSNKVLRRLLADDYRQRYTFLTAEESATLARCEIDGHPLPPLYIVERYFMRDATGYMRVRRERFGLAPAHPSLSLEAIAASMSLTRERVRQLLVKPIAFPKDIEPLAAELAKAVTAPVLTSRSGVWLDIARGSRSMATPQQLLCIVGGCCRQMTITRVGSDFYLVDKEYADRVSLAATYTEILRRIGLQRTVSDCVPLAEMVVTPASTLPDELLAMVVTIFADVLRNDPRLRFTSDGYVLLAANKIDITTVLEGILADKGKPMGFEALCEAFNAMYPGVAPEAANTFRAYIQRSREILPISRTGRYVLRSWQGIYTGTLTDYIALTLSASTVPLSASALLERCRAHFPATTEASIISLISQDTQRRFSQFDDATFGLAALDYPGRKAKVAERRSRHTVEANMLAFRRFVEEHNAMPRSNAGDEEMVLRRWVENMKSGKIVATEQQRAAFDTLLAETATLPRNTSERQFRDKCEAVKATLTKTGSLSASAEYRWLCNYRRYHPHITGNREIYLNDLLSFISTRELPLFAR